MHDIRVLSSEPVSDGNSLEFVQCLGSWNHVFWFEYQVTLFGILYTVEVSESGAALLKEAWKQGSLTRVYQMLAQS